MSDGSRIFLLPMVHKSYDYIGVINHIIGQFPAFWLIVRGKLTMTKVQLAVITFVGKESH